MLPHQTQIKICPYISLGINSHSQIAPVKLGKEDSPVSSRPHEKCLPLDSASTPKTSARPPPTCPASARAWPSCAPRGACRGVGVPVGTLCLPRLGGAALLPGGSRWSAEVSKHGEPQLRPHGSWKGRKANKGHIGLVVKKILFQAIEHSLNSERGATKHYDTCPHLR